MRNIVDQYQWSEHRKLITPAESGVAALRCFGMNLRQRASQPLGDHIHQNCMEIVFLLSGFQVYEASGSAFNLRGSDIFVTYPNEPHSSAGYLENVSDMIWMQIDLSPELPFFGLDDARALQLRNALLSLPRIFSGNDSLQQMLQESFFMLISESAFERFAGEQTLLCALLRMVKCAEQMAVRHTDRISNAVSYIHEHITEPISLDDVRLACNLSLSRFKICFKKEMGVTPREYINQVKIRQAQRLLESGHSITDTAMSMGFTTPNYFCVLFKKYTCMTPSQYVSLRQKGKCL